MESLMHFAGWRSSEKATFLLSLIAMGGVRLALLFYTPRQIARTLAAINRRRPLRPGAQPLPLRTLVRRVAQASRYSLVPPTCLSEALAAQAVLARHGHASELRIGVRKAGEKFEAHAWLECAGRILIGNPKPEGK